jgi:hypothetical protein
MIFLKDYRYPVIYIQLPVRFIVFSNTKVFQASRSSVNIFFNPLKVVRTGVDGDGDVVGLQ